MDKRPTIIDVATLAGVSKSTVSLVLQNSPLVRDETREDVRRAMAQLGLNNKAEALKDLDEATKGDPANAQRYAMTKAQITSMPAAKP